MLDHDTDSYYKISGAFVDEQPVGNLTRDSVVDMNVWTRIKLAEGAMPGQAD